VRELANRLRAQGIEPSPTKVRELLGGGSPNVIVDELRKYRQETVNTGASGASVRPSPPGAAVDFQAALKGIGQEELAAQIQQARELQLQLDETGQMMAQFVQAAQTLLQSLQAERSAYQEKMELALARFDEVSRQMMRIADSARQQQRLDKETLGARISELEGWQASLRDIAANQRTRIAVLETRLKQAGLPVE
jgi:hypothetical protein